MNIIPENELRILDNVGRITIPKGIRRKMIITNKMSMNFFTMKDENGRSYICLSPSTEEEIELDKMLNGEKNE